MENEKIIENLIKQKGLNSPRLTPEHIDSVIVNKTFTLLPSKKCLICELTLQNGFSVIGESHVVSKDNYDQEIGERISYENARNKVWLLEGYLLQSTIKEH